MPAARPQGCCNPPDGGRAQKVRKPKRQSTNAAGRREERRRPTDQRIVDALGGRDKVYQYIDACPLVERRDGSKVKCNARKTFVQELNRTICQRHGQRPKCVVCQRRKEWTADKLMCWEHPPVRPLKRSPIKLDRHPQGLIYVFNDTGRQITSMEGPAEGEVLDGRDWTWYTTMNSTFDDRWAAKELLNSTAEFSVCVDDAQELLPWLLKWLPSDHPLYTVSGFCSPANSASNRCSSRVSNSRPVKSEAAGSRQQMNKKAKPKPPPKLKASAPVRSWAPSTKVHPGQTFAQAASGGRETGPKVPGTPTVGVAMTPTPAPRPAEVQVSAKVSAKGPQLRTSANAAAEPPTRGLKASSGQAEATLTTKPKRKRGPRRKLNASGVGAQKPPSGGVEGKEATPGPDLGPQREAGKKKRRRGRRAGRVIQAKRALTQPEAVRRAAEEPLAGGGSAQKRSVQPVVMAASTQTVRPLAPTRVSVATQTTPTTRSAATQTTTTVSVATQTGPVGSSTGQRPTRRRGRSAREATPRPHSTRSRGCSTGSGLRSRPRRTDPHPCPPVPMPATTALSVRKGA
ncbi:hypothetical protein 1 [Beihai tombus-like virus 12]|uniref:hypothetical protein 1 n=1 Tax=Beihai tombus-like virus 12 TaxID=1922715 RepID=UPI00090CA10F|nr:hypothetical protein 1 [Beihai tombus-like virus 12]APG76138.1 hypothetical protein 1 [Beihai tombus-like virus 12]